MTLHIVRTSYATVYLYGTCMVHVFHHTGDTHTNQLWPTTDEAFKDSVNQTFADTLSEQ